MTVDDEAIGTLIRALGDDPFILTEAAWLLLVRANKIAADDDCSISEWVDQLAVLAAVIIETIGNWERQTPDEAIDNLVRAQLARLFEDDVRTEIAQLPETLD
jgi:hypothetical protein